MQTDSNAWSHPLSWRVQPGSATARWASEEAQAMEKPASPMTPGMSYDFTDEELLDFRKKSEAGDAESSRKLFLFYNFAVRDRSKAAEWLEKAAEQGSLDAQYGLAYEFSYQRSPQHDLEKAKYWALKAAHNGQTQARRLLQEITEREKHGDSK